jgi:hypothetical protein
MTLGDLGNIGDFLGAIAVLVTLMYLAIQVRQNSSTSRAQTRQALADSQINLLNSRVTDPFLRAVSFKMYSGEELGEAEKYALRLHIIAHIRLFENYFTQYVLGTMDKEDWRAMREVIGSQFVLPAYRQVFSYRENIWNSGFAAEVNQILGEIDEPAT